MCERCHAGQMLEYEKKLSRGDKVTVITGVRCERCSYVELSDDDAIWSV